MKSAPAAGLLALALCLAPQSALAAAPPVCPLAKGIAPGKALRLSFYARQAGRTTPQSITLEAGGPLFIHLQRVSELKGRARLVVSRSATPADPAETLCDTGWMEVDAVPPKALTVPASTVARGIWKIEIFDEIEAGPTGEFPYALDIGLIAVDAADGFHARPIGSIPSNHVFDPQISSPPVECDLAGEARSPRSGGRLETVWQRQGAEIGDVPLLAVVPASRFLWAGVAVRRPARFEVRLFAKEMSTLPFVAVCRKEVDIKAPEGGAVAVMGRAAWDRVMRPVWRVEIHNLAPSGGSERADLSLIRQWDPERSGDLEKTFRPLLKNQFVCLGRPPREKRSTAGSPVIPTGPRGEHFARVTGITLRPGGGLSGPQAVALGNALQEALGIWSAECTACNYDALSVARIDNTVFLRTDVLENLKGLRDPAAPASDRNPLPPFWFAIKGLSRPQVLQDNRPTFTALQAGDLDRFCRYPHASLPPELQRISHLVGCPGAQPPEQADELRLTVLLQTTLDTGCGSDPNIVACEADSELLELNGRDYSFLAVTDPGITLGRGPKQVNLAHVMLHEVGHWIGLDHSDNDEAMMAEAMETSRCINRDDIDRLSIVLAGGVLQGRRSNSPLALHWKRAH